MRKQVLWLFILLLLLISGCQAEKVQESEPLNIVSFSFSHNGMSSDQIYTYSAEKTENGTRLYLELNAGHHIVDETIDEPVLERLGEIAEKYQLGKWNGFDKSNRFVLDGEGFSLFMTLANGNEISASGSNSFPDGYYDAQNEICTLFEELMDRYGNLYPKTLESNELDSIMLNFTAEHGKKFLISIYEGLNENLRIDVEIHGYDEFYPGEEYIFYGYAESFPFEEIQSIVRKYDIPSWNGWDKAADNYNECEWFQMELGYASGEYITAMGTLYPENYDEARSEMLKLCGDFIHENSGSFIPWDE